MMFFSGSTDSQGYSYFRGTGRFILLKIHGQVVTKDDVTTTTTNPSAQVTYATTAFAVAVTKRLRTTPIYGSIKLFSYDMAGINATDTLSLKRFLPLLLTKHPLVVKSLMMVLSLVH